MVNQEPLFNLEVIQTNTKTWKFQLSSKSTGLPIPLAGYVVFFTVKSRLTDPDTSALIQKTFTVPENSDSDNGIMFVVLTEEDTDIPVGEYYYDFKLQQVGSGNIIVSRRTLGTGKFIVNQTITQRTM